jgi:hypothetical protein
VTAISSNKIFYPSGIVFLSTSDIFVLSDASSYKIAKLKSLDEVSLLFASGNLGFDKLFDPIKIVRGSNLDIYVLDKQTNEIQNFDNYGTYIRKLQNMDTFSIQNIAYFGDKLYILKDKYLLTYDLKSQKFDNLYYLDVPGNYTFLDLAILNKNNILLLNSNKILILKLINN